jgi:outer membrane lipase/esterase
MKFLQSLRQLGGRWVVPAGLAASLVAMVLSACGGGTSQVEPFHPTRVIVFGDENSVILPDDQANGLKYSVNHVDATRQRDCTVSPIWVQAVASTYAFVFAECNPTSKTPQAFIRAVPGAKVEDPVIGLAQQIAFQAAQGGFNDGDMVTLLIGGNDIIELYESVLLGRISFNDAMAEAERRGTVVALAANGIMATGARLLISTVPDMSRTPYARLASIIDPNAVSELSQLNYQFNAYMRTRIDPLRYDGRNYGLVLADDMINTLVNSPSNYGLTNIVDAVCLVQLPQCTDDPADLVPGGSAGTYLWADNQHMSPAGHAKLGSLAQSRALNNPF